MAGGKGLKGPKGPKGRKGPEGLAGRFATVLWVLFVPCVLFVLSSTGCSRPSPPVHDGPIILITFESLRADAVGALGGPAGLMPHLDSLARESDWVGRGIAPSSASIPSLGTLLTGLRPWQHQALHEGRPGLAPDLVTLAEALRARGYTTGGYPGDPWLHERFGLSQGFQAFAKLGRGRRALDRLANLGSGRHFVWAHLPEPGAPYIRRDEYLARLGPDAPDLPARLQVAQLEPFFDPATPLSPGLRRRFLSMYRLNAAWADERLGLFLGALRASGQWDRSLVVVTSIHGEEIGEHGQILHGGNLGRASLEVPLVVKLPEGSGLRLRPQATQRVASARIWSTLVEAAGGEPLPAAAPSLFRAAPPEVLSELYLTNGSNRFSLVDGDLQLLRDAQFAPPEPEYFRARQVAVRAQAPNRRPQRLPEAAALFRRQGQAFDAAPPFSGIGAPVLRLERWLPGGGTAPEAHPDRRAEMEKRLDLGLRRFLPEELPPAGEAAEWRGPETRRGGRWRKAR